MIAVKIFTNGIPLPLYPFAKQSFALGKGYELFVQQTLWGSENLVHVLQKKYKGN